MLLVLVRRHIFRACARAHAIREPRCVQFRLGVRALVRAAGHKNLINRRMRRIICNVPEAAIRPLRGRMRMCALDRARVTDFHRPGTSSDLSSRGGEFDFVLLFRIPRPDIARTFTFLPPRERPRRLPRRPSFYVRNYNRRYTRIRCILERRRTYLARERERKRERGLLSPGGRKDFRKHTLRLAGETYGERGGSVPLKLLARNVP